MKKQRHQRRRANKVGHDNLRPWSACIAQSQAAGTRRSSLGRTADKRCNACMRTTDTKALEGPGYEWRACVGSQKWRKALDAHPADDLPPRGQFACAPRPILQPPRAQAVAWVRMQTATQVRQTGGRRRHWRRRAGAGDGACPAHRGSLMPPGVFMHRRAGDPVCHACAKETPNTHNH